ncbi:ArsR/SmtB family transcription factor [Christiangramia aquimixticola]|uniref:ArsR/SmtB family transcription factor n=1 Tax=Christiangramia aquimixticola TaxID=1697558 RepID=UPI003AA91017
MKQSQIIDISKSLSNPTRLQIFMWLKDPEKNFRPHEDLQHFRDGVCASHIREKTSLSQSTISNFLSMMEKCQILTLTRHGKWSYYKRNEKVIKEYLLSLQN